MSLLGPLVALISRVVAVSESVRSSWKVSVSKPASGARGPGGARAGRATLHGHCAAVAVIPSLVCMPRVHLESVSWLKMISESMEQLPTVFNFQVDNRLLLQFLSHSVEWVAWIQDLQSWFWSDVLKS